MSPKEKAQELIHKYRMLLMDIGDDYGQEVLLSILSKECALIMVNELLTNSTFLLSYGELYYWQQVKQEIEKL